MFSKRSLDEFVVILMKIFNKSLELGHFAEDWKVAILRYLVKKREMLNLLSLISDQLAIFHLYQKFQRKKVLEQINEFNSLIFTSSLYQSAYKPGHSCKTTILKIINDILWAMERKEITALVMIDLAAAFDTFDHENFVPNFREKIGLCNPNFSTVTVLKWFMSHLENQQCKVCIGNDYSETITFNFSVPQDRILSPYLFNSYSNIINTAIQSEISIYAFADDHSLQKSFLPCKKEEEKTMNILESTMST